MPMDLPMHPALIPILALVAGAGLQLALARSLSPLAKGWLATVAVTIAFAGALMFVPGAMGGAVIETALLPRWDGGAPLGLRIDGLSVLFMVMGTAAGSAILLFSVRYMAHEREGLTRFYAIMLLFIAGLLLLASAADMLVAYVAWEVIGLCSYSLVGFWYREKAASEGARKVLVITHLAGYGFLAALIIVQVQVGTLDWADPKLASAFSTGVIALLLVSAMAKSVMFPLHSWIPEAMNAPTPVSALLHSACYVKAGVYLMARLYGVRDWSGDAGLALALIGAATILIGVVFAMAQTDLKRLLAYHTVSQLGYIMVGLALGGELGLTAALFYCLSHALFKGTLFMCAGAVQHAAGTRDLRELGALASAMPLTALIWLIAAASIAGVPLTNGFVAKWLILNASLAEGLLVAIVAAWVGSLLTAFSFLKATANCFYGARPAALQARAIHEPPASMLAGMGAMAALCVVFGVAPQWLLVTLVEPAVRGLGFGASLQVGWLGLSTGQGSLAITIAVAAVMVGVVAALVTLRLARGPEPAAAEAPVSVFTGGEPLAAGDRPGATDFAGMAERAFHPVYALDPDPLMLRLWRALNAAATGLQDRCRPALEGRPLAVIAGAGGLLLAGVWLS
jgi:multicomponent Na+:H+ antiporter subunit A